MDKYGTMRISVELCSEVSSMSERHQRAILLAI